MADANRPQSPQTRPLRIAIIAGEPSGDALGADLIAAIKSRYAGPIFLTGVGGEGLQAHGLRSLFDYEELSIVGVGAVVARLPQLLRRIGQTAAAIIDDRPDLLIIVDSPDFTHRVARKVKARLPDLKVVNYVAPTVWAWKPDRAAAMTAYVDHVLSVFPFEPAVLEALGGPPSTYVGHRLIFDAGLEEARAAQSERRRSGASGHGKTCLLLPGSRRGELKRLLPVFLAAADDMHAHDPSLRFLLPAFARHRTAVEDAVRESRAPIAPVYGQTEKWRAFGQADAALAASGTVLLELALAGIPCVSAYKIDPLAMLLVSKITTWSAALPNLVAGYPLIPEYFNESARANRLSRHVSRLTEPCGERSAMLAGFDLVRRRMAVSRDPGQHAAEVVLKLVGRH